MSWAAVLAARYRPGVGARATHPVHLIPLPVRVTDGVVGVVGALCGALLSPQELETVEPGRGMPCSMCVLQYAATIQPQTTELPAEAAMP